MKRQALPDKLLPEWEEICATAAVYRTCTLGLTGLKGLWRVLVFPHLVHAGQCTVKEFLGLGPEDRVLGLHVRQGRVWEELKNVPDLWSKRLLSELME